MDDRADFWEDVALVAEYPYQFGGAQRLLATLAKKLDKEIYLLDTDASEALIWDQRATLGLPPEEIALSVVVDGREFRRLPSKRNVKICHSKASLERHAEKEAARATTWLTHRERPYRYWKQRGFDITLVPDGYIPYDHERLKYRSNKKDQAVFISRISEEKRPRSACEAAQSTDIPLVMAGSWDATELVRELRSDYPAVHFPEPQQNRHVSLNQRNGFLEESKLLVHGSTGGMRDYLEYAILDGMLYGCVPVCITPDEDQFSIVRSRGLGKVVRDEDSLSEAMNHALNNYHEHLENVKDFMREFLAEQPSLMRRWEATLREVIEDRDMRAP